MIEPIDATTTSPAAETIQELALFESHIAAARTKDTVQLSLIAQASVRADEVRAEETRASTQIDINRAASTARTIQADQLRATEVAAT